ncbi:hypothetical protein LK10_05470 [Sinomonas humi]|uniref:Uncharacterized protein n=1 Tax=Sinomonas humi TaxID=1338436 RepID=A0A0B2ARA7_9MICC|nr:hypothetical protein LK10_05470 [Sinomonas humi]
MPTGHRRHAERWAARLYRSPISPVELADDVSAVAALSHSRIEGANGHATSRLFVAHVRLHYFGLPLAVSRETPR